MKRVLLVLLVVLVLLACFVGLGIWVKPYHPPAPVPPMAGDWRGNGLRVSIFEEGSRLRVSGIAPGESRTFIPGGKGVWIENPPEFKVPRRLEWKGDLSCLELRVIDDSNSQTVQQLKKVP